MFSGQLWKLTGDKKLHNQNGDWLYSSKKWVLPREGKEGSIKDTQSEKVLSILSTTGYLTLKCPEVDGSEG